MITISIVNFLQKHELIDENGKIPGKVVLGLARNSGLRSKKTRHIRKRGKKIANMVIRDMIDLMSNVKVISEENKSEKSN